MLTAICSVAGHDGMVLSNEYRTSLDCLSYMISGQTWKDQMTFEIGTGGLGREKERSEEDILYEGAMFVTNEG